MRVLVLYKHKHIGRFWICISVSLITKIIIVFLNRVFQWTISRYVKSDHIHCFNIIYCSTSRIYLFPLFTWRKIIFSLHNILLAQIWRKGFQNYFICYTPSQPRLGVMRLPMRALSKLFRNGHLIFANNLTDLKLRPDCYSFFWLQTNENRT